MELDVCHSNWKQQMIAIGDYMETLLHELFLNWWKKRQRHQHQQQDHKCFDRKCTFHRYCGMKINKRVKHFMNKFTKLNIKRWFTDPFSCINIIRFHCKNEIAKEEKHQRSTLRKHENLIILREVEKGKLH